MATVLGEGFAFIHVPKTGGNWAVEAMRAAGLELRRPDVDEALWEERAGHLFYPEVPSDLFRICFVRRPLDWYRSFWLHRHRLNDWRDDTPLDRLARQPFDQFVSQVAEECPGWLGETFSCYVGLPGDEVEFVGHYENLVSGLADALHRAGAAFDEACLRQCPPKNVSHGDACCSPETARLLECAEGEVLARFYGKVAMT